MLGETDTLVVAQVLKATIRDSAEPLLIPDSAYEPLIRAAAAHADTPETLVSELRAVVDGFSPTYSAACGLVFRFLAKVATFSKENKMSEKNLAVVFAPTALRSTNPDPMAEMVNMKHSILVVEMMITNAEEIFPDHLEVLVSPKGTEYTAEAI
mmetsp:Transcript_12430/g.22034  ORF Transcript_12430/g.22034 Transcript_12430/m.22034 type:complete len:154 (+) Transcript_12430:352-813(+)